MAGRLVAVLERKIGGRSVSLVDRLRAPEELVDGLHRRVDRQRRFALEARALRPGERLHHHERRAFVGAEIEDADDVLALHAREEVGVPREERVIGVRAGDLEDAGDAALALHLVDGGAQRLRDPLHHLPALDPRARIARLGRVRRTRELERLAQLAEVRRRLPGHRRSRAAGGGEPVLERRTEHPQRLFVGREIGPPPVRDEQAEHAQPAVDAVGEHQVVDRQIAGARAIVPRLVGRCRERHDELDRATLRERRLRERLAQGRPGEPFGDAIGPAVREPSGVVNPSDARARHARERDRVPLEVGRTLDRRDLQHDGNVGEAYVHGRVDLRPVARGDGRQHAIGRVDHVTDREELHRVGPIFA